MRERIDWKALRLARGLKQREVERQMGWQKRGYLSWIERGVEPSPERERDLRVFYGLPEAVDATIE